MITEEELDVVKGNGYDDNDDDDDDIGQPS